MTPTPAPECAQAMPSLGVYVLGAITPDDRVFVDGHLATCGSCRDELAGLVGLPGLLARVGPEVVGRICADDLTGMLTSLGSPSELADARRRRTRSRYLFVAAAAVALIVGLLAGRTFAAPAARTIAVPVWPANTAWQTAAGTSAGTGASATVAFADQPWGTAFQVLVHHIPIGTTCQLWVIHPNGTRTMAAAWTTAPDEGQHSYPGSMPSSAGPVSQFQITAGTRTLLTVTPA